MFWLCTSRELPRNFRSEISEFWTASSVKKDLVFTLVIVNGGHSKIKLMIEAELIKKGSKANFAIAVANWRESSRHDHVAFTKTLT